MREPLKWTPVEDRYTTPHRERFEWRMPIWPRLEVDAELSDDEVHTFQTVSDDVTTPAG
ncbi:MAG: hypothetical protein ACE366_04810 [Bradymonadia bacterium]